MSGNPITHSKMQPSSGGEVAMDEKFLSQATLTLVSGFRLALWCLSLKSPQGTLLSPLALDPCVYSMPWTQTDQSKAFCGLRQPKGNQT